MSTVHEIAKILGESLLPLKKATSSTNAFRALMLEMGWRIEEIPAPIADLSARITQLEESLAAISGDGEDAGLYEDLVTAVIELIDAIGDLKNEPFDPTLEALGFPARISERLVNYLLVEYLRTHHSRVNYLLEIFGVVEISYEGETEEASAHKKRELVWKKFADALQDPGRVFQLVFDWGSEEFQDEFLLQILLDLALSLRLPAYLEELDESLRELLGEAADSDEPKFAIHLPILNTTDDDDVEIKAGVHLATVPAAGGGLPGLAILPYLTGEAGESLELADNLYLTVEGSFSFADGVAITLRPGSPVETVQGSSGSGSVASVSGELSLEIRNEDTEGDPILLIGADDGSRFEYKALSLRGGLSLDSAGNADLYLETALEGGLLAVKAGSGDGFLQKVIPADGISTNVDLTVGVSRNNGFYFKGSGALEVNLPSHVDLGAVQLESITIVVRPDNGELPLELGASASLELGPLTATVENMGLAATFSFPESGGNLGPLDLSLGFKPPTGIGLSIDAQGFTGGGFLYLDSEKGRYLGGLELKFQDTISLAAVGILDTRLPGGGQGYSLLISISADFTAIQLGFGFTLNGVGGLLGLHRTMELEVLRDGLKTGAADNVLFPSDVVANADRIISDLSEIFPVYEDQFVFGPMGKLGWGTPTLITLEVGLLIEIPDPVQVAIAGVLKALLPDEDAELLVLKVGFLGTIDLEAGLISFDAAIYDSKLVSFTLSGDMALRLSWGEEPNFLLSVGGFHPAYDPPPLNLPDLERLTVSLMKGNNPRITLEAYFAVTSNTAQMGSKLEVYAEAWKVYVSGRMSFDALFQFSPFYFTISSSAMVEVGMGGEVLMSVSLDLALEGPTPWKANGTASFKVLCVKVEVEFKKTFGQSKDTTLPDVAVLPELQAALAHRDNWLAELPARSSQWVTLREMSDAEGLIAHPAGTLTVSQKVVPLEVTIDTFGNQKPSDASYFEIGGVTSDSEALETSAVTEYFAPAQYEAMSDSEKLSRNSFEKMKSGVQIEAGEDLAAGGLVKREVEYETITIDKNQVPKLGGKLSQLRGVFQSLVKGSAVAKVRYSHQNTKKSALAPQAIAVEREGFTVVSTVDLTPYDDGSSLGSQAEAHDYLDRLIAKDPNLAAQLQVVPGYEVNAA